MTSVAGDTERLFRSVRQSLCEPRSLLLPFPICQTPETLKAVLEHEPGLRETAVRLKLRAATISLHLGSHPGVSKGATSNISLVDI